MSAESPHVLVVDDDRRLRELLSKFLMEQGFLVTAAADAREAKAQAAAIRFDLMVLDVMMPGESGLSLAESIRRESDVPILMLTAMGETEDRIAGLERGADDYLVKPFEPRELVLRLKALLRRTPRAAAPAEVLRFGPWTFRPERGELLRGEDRVRLTEAETKLLAALARRPATALGRDELAREVGLDGGERAIDVQVTRLRRKIEADPREPRYLQTARGRGYMLLPD